MHRQAVQHQHRNYFQWRQCWQTTEWLPSIEQRKLYHFLSFLSHHPILMYKIIQWFIFKRVISLLLIQWVTASAPTQTQARPCWRQCTIMWHSGSSARSLCPPGATPMLSPLPSPLPSCPAFLPCFSSQRRKRPSAREPLSCQHHTPTWN